MEFKKLVNDYIDAWNRQDVSAVLALFTDDAFFCDAFWQERCRGKELESYFRESLDEEGNFYELTDGPIEFDGGIAYSYAAYDRHGDSAGRKVYDGIELFSVEDDRIAGVIDYYAILEPITLADVARTVCMHKGRTRSVSSGLPAVRASRFRNLIESLFEDDKLYLDPNLTLSQIADELGCPVNQLTEIISTQFGSSFYSLLDRHRVNYARDLLRGPSDDPDFLYRVCIEAGFRSFDRFNESFRRFFNESPEDYHRRHTT
jgi:AraC-like DNA-binding protein